MIARCKGIRILAVRETVGGGLTIRVLGPLAVAIAGRPVVIMPGRLRTLLVTMALSPGTAVSIDRLVAALWDDRLPDNPRRSLHTYVNRLRAAVGADRIATASDGYLLRIDPE